MTNIFVVMKFCTIMWIAEKVIWTFICYRGRKENTKFRLEAGLVFRIVLSDLKVTNLPQTCHAIQRIWAMLLLFRFTMLKTSDSCLGLRSRNFKRMTVNMMVDPQKVSTLSPGISWTKLYYNPKEKAKKLLWNVDLCNVYAFFPWWLWNERT